MFNFFKRKQNYGDFCSPELPKPVHVDPIEEDEPIDCPKYLLVESLDSSFEYCSRLYRQLEGSLYERIKFYSEDGKIYICSFDNDAKDLKREVGLINKSTKSISRISAFTIGNPNFKRYVEVEIKKLNAEVRKTKYRLGVINIFKNSSNLDRNTLTETEEKELFAFASCDNCKYLKKEFHMYSTSVSCTKHDFLIRCEASSQKCDSHKCNEEILKEGVVAMTREEANVTEDLPEVLTLSDEIKELLIETN